jgi:hypothetical protein
LKSELKTFHQSHGKTFQTTFVDNQLRVFEVLLSDNALFNVQNQVLANNNPKWKE